MPFGRLIPCLDVTGGRVVKGVSFKELRDVGDPVELAVKAEAEGADEVVFLDISATVEERATLLEVARATASQLFIPLTIGGGLGSVEDVTRALRAGADKVSLNSSIVGRPELISELAATVGAQCVVASIDAKRVGDQWKVFTRGGRTETPLEAVSWAQRCVALGAGEVLLTSIDRDGARTGYDLELTRAVADAVTVPVIASGGVGKVQDLVDGVIQGHASAVLAASIFHFGEVSIAQAKAALRAANIPVRPI
jgi:cyclase